MTQPAVSARIGQMEAAFAVSLVDRSRRVQAATPRGLELFGYAERMLALQSEMVARLTGPADLLGTVRIGAAETLVHTLVAPLLRALSRDHPHLTPEMTVDISPNLQLGLLGGELDVALMLGPPNDPRIRSVALRDYELVWVAAPSLLLPDGLLGPAALAGFPILSYARGTLPYAELAGIFVRPGLPPARLFANASLAAIRSMALDGIGVAPLPLAVVERELAEGSLRRLEVAVSLSPLRFVASTLSAPTVGAAQHVASLAAQLAAADAPQTHKRS